MRCLISTTVEQKSLDTAVESFVRGFSFSRSFTHPYVVGRVGPIWSVSDAPRERPQHRTGERVSRALPAAEVDRVVRANARGRFTVGAVVGVDESIEACRDVFKSIGHRRPTTEERHARCEWSGDRGAYRWAMPVLTRRWDDPPLKNEGLRVLVTRYRPRGLAKSDETWDVWEPDLGPGKTLHAAAYGKVGSGLAWATYVAMYTAEMKSQKRKIAELADRVRRGETVTLLCSSQCDREARCHRSLLREMILACL